MRKQGAGTLFHVLNVAIFTDGVTATPSANATIAIESIAQRPACSRCWQRLGSYYPKMMLRFWMCKVSVKVESDDRAKPEGEHDKSKMRGRRVKQETKW